MQIIKTPLEMQSIAASWRAGGEKIAFVPTMGALHEGHVSLLTKAKPLGTKLVLSIYVNPTQFSPNEDLAKYPRPLERDLEKAHAAGVDAVFLPSDEVMYDEKHQTFVEVTRSSKGLCGDSRPTHFRGVATVVLKLFNITKADVAVFGEKDYQQLIVIKSMARDLNLPVEIIGAPIVRESDGLAMSSRNAYLSAEERKSALSLNQALKTAHELAKAGEKNAGKLVVAAAKIIEDTNLGRIDYLKICDAETLEEIETIEKPARIFVAAYFGKTRLIDNLELS